MLMVEAEIGIKDIEKCVFLVLEQIWIKLTNCTAQTTEEEAFDIELDGGDFWLIGHNDREDRFEHAKVNHVPHAVASFLAFK